MTGAVLATQATIHQRMQHQQQKKTFMVGQADIGGQEWQMFNHEGKLVDQTAFEGKYQLVYFGFTFCPDVCPRELTKMARVELYTCVFVSFFFCCCCFWFWFWFGFLVFVVYVVYVVYVVVVSIISRKFAFLFAHAHVRC